ncbi:hypothetical protein SDC9_204092 [bioreactor metagenome]|uniref:Uncharacterized protein n=1 Tax=bioreactor metagenome TaxID=1076179 RepID=A0A645J7G0_9ZZZZ
MQALERATGRVPAPGFHEEPGPRQAKGCGHEALFFFTAAVPGAGGRCGGAARRFMCGLAGGGAAGAGPDAVAAEPDPVRALPEYDPGVYGQVALPGAGPGQAGGGEHQRQTAHLRFRRRQTLRQSDHPGAGHGHLQPVAADHGRDGAGRGQHPQ